VFVLANARTIQVHVPKSATLRLLKETIVSVMKPPPVAVETRLRRYITGGGTGSLYQDELLPLPQVGLSDGSRVVIEKGAPPSRDVLTLQFVFGADGRRVTDIMAVDAQRTWTIAQAKQAMIQYVFSAGGGVAAFVLCVCMCV
jgi:hypothetical protein